MDFKSFDIASNPKAGPIPKNTKTYSIGIFSISKLINWMLMIVIEKPMQLTMVRAVPIDAFGAVWATNVENCGESEITTNPQKNRKSRNKKGGISNAKRESKQQQPDANKEQKAILSLPYFCER